MNAMAAQDLLSLSMAVGPARKSAVVTHGKPMAIMSKATTIQARTVKVHQHFSLAPTALATISIPEALSVLCVSLVGRIY